MAARTQTRADEARTEGSREAKARPRVWRQPQALSAPPPRAGMRQRWVRKTLLGQLDDDNVQYRFEEGWEPRDPTTVPERHLRKMNVLPEGKGMIERRGFILCEMPIEMVEQRTEYYRDQTDQMERAVEENLHRVQDPGMPISKNNKTKVYHPRARQPKVQDDEDDSDFDEDDE